MSTDLISYSKTRKTSFLKAFNEKLSAPSFEDNYDSFMNSEELDGMLNDDSNLKTILSKEETTVGDPHKRIVRQDSISFETQFDLIITLNKINFELFDSSSFFFRVRFPWTSNSDDPSQKYHQSQNYYNNATEIDLNFLIRVPLFFNERILNELRSSFISIEILQRNQTRDKILGLVKLPIYSLYSYFFTVYNSSEMTHETKENVLSDGWIAVFNVIKGYKIGQLHTTMRIVSIRDFSLSNLLTSTGDDSGMSVGFLFERLSMHEVIRSLPDSEKVHLDLVYYFPKQDENDGYLEKFTVHSNSFPISILSNGSGEIYLSNNSLSKGHSFVQENCSIPIVIWMDKMLEKCPNHFTCCCEKISSVNFYLILTWNKHRYKERIIGHGQIPINLLYEMSEEKKMRSLQFHCPKNSNKVVASLYYYQEFRLNTAEIHRRSAGLSKEQIDESEKFSLKVTIDTTGKLKELLERIEDDGVPIKSVYIRTQLKTLDDKQQVCNLTDYVDSHEQGSTSLQTLTISFDQILSKGVIDALLRKSLILQTDVWIRNDYTTLDLKSIPNLRTGYLWSESVTTMDAAANSTLTPLNQTDVHFGSFRFCLNELFMTLDGRVDNLWLPLARVRESKSLIVDTLIKASFELVEGQRKLFDVQKRLCQSVPNSESNSDSFPLYIPSGWRFKEENIAQLVHYPPNLWSSGRDVHESTRKYFTITFNRIMIHDKDVCSEKDSFIIRAHWLSNVIEFRTNGRCHKPQSFMINHSKRMTREISRDLCEELLGGSIKVDIFINKGEASLHEEDELYGTLEIPTYQLVYQNSDETYNTVNLQRMSLYVERDVFPFESLKTKRVCLLIGSFTIDSFDVVHKELNFNNSNHLEFFPSSMNNCEQNNSVEDHPTPNQSRSIEHVEKNFTIGIHRGLKIAEGNTNATWIEFSDEGHSTEPVIGTCPYWDYSEDVFIEDISKNIILNFNVYQKSSTSNKIHLGRVSVNLELLVLQNNNKSILPEIRGWYFIYNSENQPQGQILISVTPNNFQPNPNAQLEYMQLLQNPEENCENPALSFMNQTSAILYDSKLSEIDCPRLSSVISWDPEKTFIEDQLKSIIEKMQNPANSFLIDEHELLKE